MPHTFNYSQILPLASPQRLASYQLTFSPTNEKELYGVYVWAQHAVGSLYPLTNNVEIALRNSIDNEARRRFGDKWWMLPQFNNANTKDFIDNINKAKSSLDKAWKQAERIRLGLPSGAALPSSPPTWSHDKIIAATDFSTWEHVLKDSFSAPNRAQESNYLWPRSMGKVFRKYNIISASSTQARHDILAIVREIREYRNRLFHHDKIWVSSSSGGVNDIGAIESIRRKINKMELILSAIDQRLLSLLEKVGIVSQARRVCAMDQLNIYRYAHAEPKLTAKKKRIIRSISSKAKNENSTVAWEYGGSLYGLFKVR
ncbi:Abi family protein [Chromobacterium sp. IIBBL 290-4]|uniref:Abi family protein n=1 Tax=Chromobacterium sp. IIBBL 290-4 TaxID=2953890 RepID=UPI0020B67182|nr:Abi family protein [Chromobacterium sp. IIBBL 290-4]UTH75640.1 Abi family protein [Chromobacterium sp. IIBBL 290-4]